MPTIDSLRRLWRTTTSRGLTRNPLYHVYDNGSHLHSRASKSSPSRWIKLRPKLLRIGTFVVMAVAIAVAIMSVHVALYAS
jgi:hypothetical protein